MSEQISKLNKTPKNKKAISLESDSDNIVITMMTNDIFVYLNVLGRGTGVEPSSSSGSSPSLQNGFRLAAAGITRL